MFPNVVLFAAAAANLALVGVNGYLVHRNRQTFAALTAMRQQVEEQLTQLLGMSETQRRTFDTLNRLGGGEQSSPDQTTKPCEQGMTLQPGESCGVVIEIPTGQLNPSVPLPTFGKR